MGVAGAMHLCLFIGCVEIGAIMFLNGATIPWSAFCAVQLMPIWIDLGLGTIVFFTWVYTGDKRKEIQVELDDPQHSLGVSVEEIFQEQPDLVKEFEKMKET